MNVRGAEAAVRATARAGVRAPRADVARPRRSARRTARSATRTRRTAARTCRSTSAPSTRARWRRSRRRERDGVELVSVNPSSVQGPGRAGGTGRIMIAYLNGKLRAFVDTNISIVDIGDCVGGHLLAAERGRAGRALRAQRGDADVERGARDRVGHDRRRREADASCRPPSPRPPPSASRARSACAGKHPPVCREMVRTMLHGHRYDGSRADARARPHLHAGARHVPRARSNGRCLKVW